MKLAKRTLPAFTLIEIMLTVSILAIVFGLSMPFIMSLQNRNDLDIATSGVVSSLRRAQTLARAMDGDSTWGTKVVSGSVVTFRGASYASRNTTYDESFSINPNIVITGLSEVVFSKLTGDPQQTGTTTLTFNADVRTVVINTKGTITY
jgi:type II secretory pathway pseudopilin PulG